MRENNFPARCLHDLASVENLSLIGQHLYAFDFNRIIEDRTDPAFYCNLFHDLRNRLDYSIGYEIGFPVEIFLDFPESQILTAIFLAKP